MENGIIKDSPWRWVVFVPAVVFVLYHFLLQLSMGVLVGDMSRSLRLSALGVGLLASTYYYIYVILQTPAGMIIDQFGSRKVLSIGGMLCALGCALMVWTHSWVAVALGRAMTGLGASCGFVAGLALIRAWFHESRFTFMMCLLELVCLLGTVFCQVYLAKLVMRVGWQDTIFYGMCAGLLIGISAWLLIRDRGPYSCEVVSESQQNGVWSLFRAQLKIVVRKREMWMNAFSCGLLYSLISVFASLWSIPYLEHVYSVTLPVATRVTGMIYLGAALGCLFINKIVILVKSDRLVIAAGGVSSAVLFCILLYTPHLSLGLVAWLMFVLGVCCSSNLLSYTIANRDVPEFAKNLRIGFTNTLALMVAPLLQPLIGYILGILGGDAAEGVMNTVGQYRLVFSLFPLAFIGSALLAWYGQDRTEERMSVQKVFFGGLE